MESWTLIQDPSSSEPGVGVSLGKEGRDRPSAFYKKKNKNEDIKINSITK